MEGVTIRREVRTDLRPFGDYFKGFERLACVRELFGEKTEEVLRGLKVEFNSFRWGYMGVSPSGGHLLVSAHYLKNGDPTDIYLDLVHELVHVRQHMEGKELFAEGYAYVDRPTEIEAYAHTVKEGRRIGLSDETLFEYLKTEWMTDEEHLRLAKRLGVRGPAR